MLKYLKHLFQLILSPGHGWEDISASRIDSRALASAGFYPLTALTALTEFVARFYHDSLTVSQLLMNAITTFVMFFIGYFISTFAISFFMAGVTDGDVSEQRNHTFVLYVLGLLELLMIVQNCVPVPMAIIFFLPVYVVIIMWKASRYLRIASGMTDRFVAGSVAGVLAPPYLLMLLMNIVLPS